MNTSIHYDTTAGADRAYIRESIANYWNWRSSSFDKTSAQQQVWWEAYLAAIGENKQNKVLDIGTGTGFIALGLAEHGHQVTGIDIAPEMLAHAKNKATLRGVEIDFLVADAEKPPFSPKSFDVIVCRNLLWTLCNPEQAIKNWYQLLQPGGRIIVSDGIWQHSTRKTLLQKIKEYTRTILRSGAHSYSLRFELAYRSVKKTLPHFNGLTAKDVESILYICGFSNLSRHDHIFANNPYPKDHSSDFFIMAGIK